VDVRERISANIVSTAWRNSSPRPRRSGGKYQQAALRVSPTAAASGEGRRLAGVIALVLLRVVHRAHDFRADLLPMVGLRPDRHGVRRDAALTSAAVSGETGKASSGDSCGNRIPQLLDELKALCNGEFS